MKELEPDEAEAKANDIAERAAMLPPDEGDELIRAETKNFPPGIRAIIMTQSAKNAEQKRINNKDTSSARGLQICGFIVGVIAMVIVVWFVFTTPYPSQAQWWTIRWVATLGGAGIASGLSGFLSVKTRLGALSIAAGGGFAVFVLTYFYNPPELPPERPHTAPAVTSSPAQ